MADKNLPEKSQKLLNFIIAGFIFAAFATIFLGTVRELAITFTLTFVILFSLALPLIFAILIFRKLRDILK